MENSKKPRVSMLQKYSVSIKLGIISFLALVLLIPTEMIKSVIFERQKLNEEAISEVSSKWANEQQVIGPVLTIPLIYEEEKDGKKTLSTRYYYLLPELLEINGEIYPEILKRGIFKTVVYRSLLKLKGDLILTDDFDKTNLKEIQSDAAFLTFGLSDLRGIEDEVKLKWNGQKVSIKPGTHVHHISSTGFSASPSEFNFEPGLSIPFDLEMKVKGSKNLSFVPLGKVTNTAINSVWASPKFNGNFLPNERNVSENGFQASWKVLELNRNFPQSWTDVNHSANLASSGFGVELLLPLDDYQKSMRSAKYAFMTISLTFLVFFLVEILWKRNIHPFQYGMVGFAICLFYILLISISEHSTFNFAYGISTIGIIGMITLYSLSLFKSKRYSLLLALILLGNFGFLFVTLQLEDYALLMGSIGLFVILGATMYFTRKIDWNNIYIGTVEKEAGN